MSDQLALDLAPLPPAEPTGPHLPARALMHFEGVRWPEVERWQMEPGHGVSEFYALGNHLALAQQPGGGCWAVGLSTSNANSGGTVGSGWGALPKWGTFATRDEAVQAARRYFESRADRWEDKQANRALRKAWTRLFNEIERGVRP